MLMNHSAKSSIASLPSLKELDLPPMGSGRQTQALSLFSFFFLSVFFQESIFRCFVYGRFLEISILFTSLFSLVAAGIFSLVCTLGSEKWNRALSLLFSLIVFLLYGTQLVYFDCFKVPLALYSVGQVSQIADFSADILVFIWKNFLKLGLLLLPALLMLLFGRKLGLYRRIRPKGRGTLFGVTLASYLTVLVILLSLGTGNAAHNLYFNINDNETAQRTFGVLTNLRLEMQRLVFGFEEHIPENFEDFSILPSAPVSSADVETPPKVQPPKPDVPETPVEYPPNITAIDFDRFLEDTSNRVTKEMHEYFQGVEPTLKNEYTGLFKGDNLIVLTGESFSTLAVHEKYTPTLYKLSHEGFRFREFYNPVWGVSTSDGEYVASTGLLPKSNTWSFYRSADNFMPFGLGNQFLKQGGYTQPRAYHNHTYTYYKRHLSHPNMGYLYKGLGKGLEVKRVWPESDLEMMEKTIPEYIAENRFHAYYMTVSGHMFYSFSGNAMAARNREAVADAPYSEEAKAYLAANIELDKALAYLLEALEKAGKLENTVIVLSGDHYPYGLGKAAMDELAGKTVEENFGLYNSTLILWKQGMEPIDIKKPASSLDILPTISNLFGLEYDSRLMAGRDILSTCDSLVIFKDRSWLTDKATYNAKTTEVVCRTAEEVSDDYVRAINREVANRFKYSTLILEQDYYGTVYGASGE